MTYQEWFKQIIFMKDKVILPNKLSIDKKPWIKSKGFDIDGFNSFLKQQYYKQLEDGIK